MKLLAAHKARSKYPVFFFEKCFSIHQTARLNNRRAKSRARIREYILGAKSCHKVQENYWRREKIKCMLRLYDDADINV